MNTEQFSELNRLYCELTWKMQDVEIPIKDKDTTCLSNRAYIFLLEPGTVVRFKGRTYFYSCPLGMMNLEGTWTNEESVSYSVHEFMWMVVDDGQPVEVVLEG